MRVVAFIYDFPHQKSLDGVLELLALKHEVFCIAQPFKQLTVPKSKKRVFYKDMQFRKVSDFINPVNYMVSDHDSLRTIKAIEKLKFDCGLILGARVLKNKDLINMLPIINLHPGVLPINRGLDNLKWAILNDQPQGITSHVISDKIDEGKLIERKLIDVYEDDSFTDIFVRLMNLQINMIGESVRLCKSARPLQRGFPYRSAVPDELDETLDAKFIDYKKNYKAIKERYLENEKNLHFVPYMEQREDFTGMLDGEFKTSRVQQTGL